MFGTTVCIVLCIFSFLSVRLNAQSIAASGDGGNLTINVDPSGTYDVATTSPAWHFHGTVGAALTNLQTASSADSVGAFSEVAFDFQSGGVRHASIRGYWDHAQVLFILHTAVPSANTLAFPNFSQYPQNLAHLTFSGIFAPPTFSDFSNESPWIFFDSSYHSFILSPAANFMAASTFWGPNQELASGIDSRIASLPQDFEQRTLLVIDTGINRTFDVWGQTLTALHSKTRPPNDADPSLAKLGYWTDNGATYYYHMADSMSYPQTLAAVKADFDRAGIGLGYLQLDSWFYPKGSPASWSNNGSGIYEYMAASPPFTAGLANFQQNLGIPLITHARWIDPKSPYRATYRMSGNVVLDQAYWQYVAGYLASSGVATYEQDWLDDKAQPDFNLNDAQTFLDNMAAAMAARNLTMQYCMASPRHFLQSARYGNLTSIRTSADRLNRDRWTEFLYTSRLASAMGIWPFTDNFNSTETDNLLVATLSAGPVGLGDPIGSLDTANILRAVRSDGVIVKPDVPLAPADLSYTNVVNSVDTPQIAATYSDFEGLRTSYWFAYPTGANTQVSFTPAALGASRRLYLYDYFKGTGEVVNPSDTVSKSIDGDSLYLVAVPVGPSEMAVVGDTGQFVPAGKKRIAGIVDDGEIRLSVLFAGGETARTITGYSPFLPAVQAMTGLAGPVAYDPETRQFQIPVSPGPDSAASLRIFRSHTHSLVHLPRK